MQKRFKIGDIACGAVSLEPGIVVAHVHYDDEGESYRYMVSFGLAERIYMDEIELITEEEANIKRMTGNA